MIRAPVLRLKSDVSLRFGDADVPTGNLAPGFAGAYGVWLRRAAWRSVATRSRGASTQLSRARPNTPGAADATCFRKP